MKPRRRAEDFYTGGPEPYVFEIAWFRTPLSKPERIATVELSPEQVVKAGGTRKVEIALDADRRMYARRLRERGLEGTVDVVMHRGYRRALWPAVGLRKVTAIPAVAAERGLPS